MGWIMGQTDILKFLKENENVFFSVRELTGLFGLNYKVVYGNLKRLAGSNFIKYKEVRMGDNVLGLYGFVRDDDFSVVLRDVSKVKGIVRDWTHRTDYSLLLLVLVELKKLNKLLGERK